MGSDRMLESRWRSEREAPVLRQEIRAMIAWAQSSDGVPLDAYEVERRLKGILRKASRA